MMKHVCCIHIYCFRVRCLALADNTARCWWASKIEIWSVLLLECQQYTFYEAPSRDCTWDASVCQLWQHSHVVQNCRFHQLGHVCSRDPTISSHSTQDYWGRMWRPMKQKQKGQIFLIRISQLLKHYCSLQKLPLAFQLYKDVIMNLYIMISDHWKENSLTLAQATQRIANLLLPQHGLPP